MATTSTTSNRFLYEFASGNIDLDGDTIRIILMNTTFSFNRKTHDTLADVTSDQLPGVFGYTQDAKTLYNPYVSRIDASDKVTVSWDNPSWTAVGGDIGWSGAAIIYDDSTDDDIIIGCIDFGTDIKIDDGESTQIVNIIFELS